MILCGTPDEHCCGGKLNSDQGLQHKKCHSNREEAFRCYTKYLVKVLGYKRIGPRDFFKEGEYVLMVSKKSKFGGYLKTGKELTRYMPDERKSAGNRGVIY